MEVTEDNNNNVEAETEENEVGAPYVLVLQETDKGLEVSVSYDEDKTDEVVIALGNMAHAIFMNRLNRIAEESMKDKEGAIYIPDAPKLIM